MSNRVALILALLILAFLAWDNILEDGHRTLFLLRKFSDLVEWIAFWR